MTKWEYKIIYLKDFIEIDGKDQVVSFDDQLNAWGILGWELVNISVYETHMNIGDTIFFVAALKRPLKD